MPVSTFTFTPTDKDFNVETGTYSRKFSVPGLHSDALVPSLRDISGDVVHGDLNVSAIGTITVSIGKSASHLAPFKLVVVH